MEKGRMTSWQGISLIVMFLLGSQAVMGVSSEAGADTFLGIVTGLVMALPMVLVYARLKKLQTEKDLFDMLIWVFGRWAGKICIALLTWYALHLGALVLRNFTEFISAVTLPETPQMVTALLMGLTAVWAAKSGADVMGRWSSIYFVFVAFTLLVTVLLAMPYFDLQNLRPAAYNGIMPLINGGTSAFAMPFAETVVFLMAVSAFKREANPYRVFFGGVTLGGVILALLSLRDTLVLGGESLAKRYYPSYTAVKVISLGDFFQRFEIIVGGVFLLCGFVKAAVCLIAAARGIAKLSGIGDYRKITAPVGLLMIIFSVIVYSSMMQMFNWLPFYKYYALPFEVLLPLIVWVVAEIRAGSGKKRKAAKGVRAGNPVA
ncbi:MAG: GerAB/ArcD/ProY family transporter [Bacillota bacterium]